MRRSEVVSHLRSNGCQLLREGRRHSWWHNPALNKRSAVPRYNEISDTWLEKYAEILESHRRDNSRGRQSHEMQLRASRCQAAGGQINSGLHFFADELAALTGVT